MPTLPTDMRVIEIKGPGGPEQLAETRRQLPAIGANEVLVRIYAAGVNRPEVLQRLGLYPPPAGATDIPGLEASGEIAAIGENVTRWRIGDQVCALLPGGGYGEYASVDAGSCLPVPQSLSLIEAAALPETVFTVWANVFDDADLKAGETLLVHGGTSGIGVMAILLAKARGANVIATAGTPEKLTQCKQIGTDEAYNYRDDPWDDAIIAAGGADVVLDMAGGDFLNRNLSVLTPGGRHVSIAFLRGISGEINIMNIMRKRLVLSGSTMKARAAAEKARLAADIEREVWPLFESGAVAPVIDRIFPLCEAGAAQSHMESGRHLGKIILKVI